MRRHILKLWQPEYFKSLLGRPFKKGDPAAGKLLKAVISQILIRRTKNAVDKNGFKLVELPPIEYYQLSVILDHETRQMYDKLLAVSARTFQMAMDNGEVRHLSTVPG
jgi:SWI/SNF-related matrix-associated actin-dependent regulator of chromatin subfamily A3